MLCFGWMVERRSFDLWADAEFVVGWVIALVAAGWSRGNG